MRAGQPPQGRRVALIVEAQPVDDRVVAATSRKMRGFGLPACGQRRHGADFGEAEAEPQHRVGHLGILVVAGGHADAGWETPARQG